MKKATGLALVALAAAVVAASAQGGQRVSAASTAVNCSSTMKIAFVTPLTGGAGFLGNEQLEWAKYAVKTLAPQMGLKIQLVTGDYVQGPSDASFMVKSLHVKKVVVLDFQEPYSLGLADAVQASLNKAGVATIRMSAPNTTTDYSAYVTKVPNDADIVFFPTQKPGDAQTFAQQLLEQGKKAKVFGGDGSNNPDQFKVPGSYVSNFAPDIN